MVLKKKACKVVEYCPVFVLSEFWSVHILAMSEGNSFMAISKYKSIKTIFVIYLLGDMRFLRSYVIIIFLEEFRTHNESSNYFHKV